MSGFDLGRFDPAYGMREELGLLAQASGRELNRRAEAETQAAQNLLNKAVRALAEGDDDRTNRFVERAAGMPYVEREEDSPGIRGASMLLYDEVADRFEESGPDDEGWLDIALAVHAVVDGPGKAELASIINGFVLQDRLFAISASERRRIRDAVGDAPLEADLGDGPDVTVEQRRVVIRSLVETVLALREAYAAAESAG